MLLPGHKTFCPSLRGFPHQSISQVTARFATCQSETEIDDEDSICSSHLPTYTWKSRQRFHLISWFFAQSPSVLKSPFPLPPVFCS